MKKKILDVIKDLKEEGLEVSSNEIIDVVKHCKRKMQVAGIKAKDRIDYLPLLFEDEMKNYCIRREINSLMFEVNSIFASERKMYG